MSDRNACARAALSLFCVVEEIYFMILAVYEFEGFFFYYFHLVLSYTTTPPSSSLLLSVTLFLSAFLLQFRDVDK